MIEILFLSIGLALHNGCPGDSAQHSSFMLSGSPNHAHASLFNIPAIASTSVAGPVGNMVRRKLQAAFGINFWHATARN